MTWQDAMGIVVLEGLLIFVLVLTGFRKAVFEAVPAWLKTAISVGIGLFIAFIGFFDAGFVSVPWNPDAPPPSVPVELGVAGSISSWTVAVFVFGLLLTIILMVKKVRGAILISILATTVLAIIVNAVAT